MRGTPHRRSMQSCRAQLLQHAPVDLSSFSFCSRVVEPTILCSLPSRVVMSTGHVKRTHAEFLRGTNKTIFCYVCIQPRIHNTGYTDILLEYRSDIRNGRYTLHLRKEGTNKVYYRYTALIYQKCRAKYTTDIQR